MTNLSTAATHEEIARRAFKIWCENGRPPGREKENWAAAEREWQREREHEVMNALQDMEDA